MQNVLLYILYVIMEIIIRYLYMVWSSSCTTFLHDVVYLLVSPLYLPRDFWPGLLFGMYAYTVLVLCDCVLPVYCVFVPYQVVAIAGLLAEFVENKE